MLFISVAHTPLHPLLEEGLGHRLARRENAYGGGLLLRPPAECRKALGQRKRGREGGRTKRATGGSGLVGDMLHRFTMDKKERQGKQATALPLWVEQ